MAEHERFAGRQVGGDGTAVDGRLRRVGGQHHDDVSFGRGLLGGHDGQPFALTLRPRAATLIEADAHVCARIAQVQRMCVPLAAVADNGDLLTRQQRLIRVFVIIDSCQDVVLLMKEREITDYTDFTDFHI